MRQVLRLFVARLSAASFIDWKGLGRTIIVWRLPPTGMSNREKEHWIPPARIVTICVNAGAEAERIRRCSNQSSEDCWPLEIEKEDWGTRGQQSSLL